MKREIEVMPGKGLEDVVSELITARENGESVYCKFNGHTLDSDTVTMDSAFLEVTGRTKDDFMKAREEYLKALERSYEGIDIPREFDLGAVLNITTGRLFTNMGDVEEVCTFLARKAKDNMSSLLDQGVMRDYILSVYPELTGVGTDVVIKDFDDAKAYVDSQKKAFGERLPLTPMSKGYIREHLEKSSSDTNKTEGHKTM